MPVALHPVTEDNLSAVMRLDVAERQREFVAPNHWSLSEAYVHQATAWPRAIVDGETVVGFLMLSLEPDAADGRCWWLWRLMVGVDHQRKGYGSAALALACDELRSRGATDIYTSWVPADDGPEPFYVGLGFVPTGEYDEDGERVARLVFGEG